MIKSNLFDNSFGSYSVVDKMGKFSVLEYDRDFSINSAYSAISEYYAAKMNYKKKQLVCTLSNNGVIMQAGAMQIMAGDVKAITNVKGATDLIKKIFGGKWQVSQVLNQSTQVMVQ
jgi:uncharacterized protein (AIM24 family)